MKYATVEAPTYSELQRVVAEQYGESAKIISQRTIRKGGIMGLFGKDVIEAWVSYHDKKLKDALEAQKILQLTSKPVSNTLLLEEIRQLHKKIEFQHKKTPEHPPNLPGVEHIEKLLIDNGFDPEYIEYIKSKMRAFFSLEQMEDEKFVHHKVCEWISDTINTATLAKKGRGTVLCLIGPTGVGKTTTVAKLAFRLGYSKEGKKIRNIRIITIDNYRIEAKEQLERYGEILRIPVDMVVSKEELRTKLALYEDVDYILIDTIGKSPHETAKIGEMQELLRVCAPKCHFALTVSATTKQADIGDILRQYHPFKYSSIIVTKLDETYSIGNIISALRTQEVPISFLTTGQTVPPDIECASVPQLLMRLKGLELDPNYNTQLSKGEHNYG